MIQPTRQLIGLLGAGLLVALLPVFIPALWVVWVGYVGVMLVVAGADLAMTPTPRELDGEVELPSTLSLGSEGHLTWQLTRTPARLSTLQLIAGVEGDVEPPVLTTARAEEGAALSARQRLMPTRRGVVHVQHVHLRWTGPLRLWWRTRVDEVDEDVEVVPNLGAVRRGMLRLKTHHAMMHGAKQRRFIGDGSEFEALREYIPGLDIRGIDWRATARTRQLMCRENRSERDHRIVIALDVGNLMGEPLDGIPRLDHAIHAGMMMAYTSLKMGDQVGLFAFDAEPRAYLEPRPGARTLHRLVEQSARLEPMAVETNFTLAMTELATRQRRRSVIVILTDFIDAVSAELMVERTRWMARRHLVMFVAIRAPSITATITAAPHKPADVPRAVIADQIARDRALVLGQLRRAGVICVDAEPAHVGVELLNRYIEVHRRELV